MEKVEIRDRLIKELTELVIRHQELLRNECFAVLGPFNRVNEITGTMFEEYETMLNKIDKYRQDIDW